MTIDIHASREGDATEITITATSSPCCGSGEAATDARKDAATEAGRIKAMVREKYAAIASAEEEGCGCGCGEAPLGEDLTMIGDEYDGVAGYVADADLRLGCGLPTELAELREGHTVLDLGSGAGVDAFVARAVVGETGRVLGVDMTPEMVRKARANAEKLGYDNVHFHEGDIEALPLEDETVDVVVSNCVLNLVPDKRRAFAEMYRVIRPGGHFCVSDVVVRGEMPEAVRRSAELYAGCVAGAAAEETYLAWLREAGFEEVRVVAEKVIPTPETALRLIDESGEEGSLGTLVSVTVFGKKP
ncbi:arsenite methyltransferase [Rhodocaloribacter sp.]